MPSFPFAAIVGQEEMKLALLLVSIDRSIGGVMVFGDRGTGKSTAARSLAALLPQMKVVAGCRFNCDPDAPAGECTGVCDVRTVKNRTETKISAVPVVDLPLGATEDRVVGALDLERALTRGEKAFEPGLLAKAHRGFLYIDEVNLLEDHLVDLLLDVAASGENIVEREGLSVRHPAQFILIGSGNPEEGELRPQLLDRFGLSVEVRSPDKLEERIEILRRRDAFECDPPAFLAAWRERNGDISNLISAARERVKGVSVDDEMLAAMSGLCMAVGADGLRGELTLMRASRAAAALACDSAVGREHIRRVAAMALRHRLRRDPLDESGSTARIDRAMTEVIGA
jgi:magnesium chelatase subunit I